MDGMGSMGGLGGDMEGLGGMDFSGFNAGGEDASDDEEEFSDLKKAEV
jgi:hypothetical protein